MHCERHGWTSLSLPATWVVVPVVIKHNTPQNLAILGTVVAIGP